MENYVELIFTQIENKIYPEKQLVGTFFVSERLLERAGIEVRPLTIGHLIAALARNHTRIIYWRFARTLWKLGFIQKPANVCFSWRRHWRWIPRQSNRKM